MTETTEVVTGTTTTPERRPAGTGNAGARRAGGGRPGGNRRMGRRKKRCPLLEAKIDYIDYKDVKLLERFIGDNKRILPRRLTGVNPTMQRRLARAIKRAKHLALLPYVQSI
ncbi:MULTISPECIES: 30S ribosomal protein S18 [Chloracidobacterium]|uniref:Small ribosomal subunit protein bS18 n=1 Tax=Chloracidobacterium sp. N TaxID=2821540 RepID=A0ABX8B2W6_9BACT|nr:MULTISPECIES: 30S ribosomal protein S18 [Chloracidobacterium]QUV88872.1 30S ribosomal protein S18 [Chloracidobacterium sp. S]QUV91937.1 30S ribosomal protein S18 [Chloracidobacterium sp. A]QUV94970.1 30S ribosomal protein S18 [Chloracidobacterium sp. N]QUV98025.1 30S ribosomal protein S18 [Chloracidobacterium sp. E]QUV84557.1 30S ribosomal protein S18 [Chloracidobacterium sp. 2]